MSWISMLAIYFIMWWVTLFVVLPFGVRNASEEGVDVAQGHEPGAPVAPQLAKKAVITTIVSSLLFILFYWLVTSGLFGLDDLPFLPKAI